MNYNTELLAPVGSMESLYAAISNGADAVYLGGKSFSARHFASNFDYDELKEVINYAHINDVKVYVTINILLDNTEIEEALDYVRFLYQADVDAIIVQDLGFAIKVKKIFPELDIHASTQMTINNLEGVKLLEKLGFKRVVLARETPIEEIKRIKNGSSIELEGFIHGALCVSYSGQCLMSSLIGGRSGNRGKCAQPCRMPYSLVDSDGELVEDFEKLHLLSPKDLNLLDDIESLKEAGISSFKIEGRMKRPEYVATIVSTYRKVIDSKEKPSEEEREDVRQIFNRGFTKGIGFGEFGKDFITLDRPDNRGVYLGKVVDINRDNVIVSLEKDLQIEDGIEFKLSNGRYRGMKSPVSGKKGEIIEIKRIGNIARDTDVSKSSSIDLLKKAQISYEENKNLYPIDMEAEIQVGKKPSLKLSYGDYEIKVEADFITDTAKNMPLTKDVVEEQLSKLGDTQFTLNKLNIDLDEESFLPLGVLNSLRRDASYEFNSFLQNKNKRDSIRDEDYNDKKKEALNIKNSDNINMKKLSIKIENIEQLEKIDYNEVDRVYIPLSKGIDVKINRLKQENLEVYVNTGKILYGEDFENLKDILDSLEGLVDGVSVENLGTLYFLRENYDFKIHGDIGLNVFNSFTAEELRSLGLDSMTLSPELTLSQIKVVEKLVNINFEAVVYGYLPVMTTITCPIAVVKGCKDDKECKICNFANGYGLKDRIDKTFNFSRKEGYSTIYNSVPLMLLDSMKNIYNSGISIGRLEFTNPKENIAEIQSAFYKVKNDEWTEKDARSFIDHIKETTEITKGHFFRGVL